jgi:hypothetical protein
MIAEAQIRKGTGFIGGALYGNSNDNTNTDYQGNQFKYKSSYFNLTPSYGKYISNKVAIGVGLGFNGNTNSNTGTYTSGTIQSTLTTEQKSLLFSIVPFVRWSHSFSEQLFCFTNFYISAGMGTQKNSTTFSGGYSSPPSTKSSQTNFGAGFNTGLNYFLNNHFAFLISYGNLSYSYTTSKPDDTKDKQYTYPDGSLGTSHPNSKTVNNTFNFNFGLSSIGLGLQYFFNSAAEKK